MTKDKLLSAKMNCFIDKMCCVSLLETTKQKPRAEPQKGSGTERSITENIQFTKVSRNREKKK